MFLVISVNLYLTRGHYISVEEWKAILDVLMPWHSTLEPAIVSGLKSKEATQNAAKQLRATLTSFSSMYAQQLKPFSDSINTDM